MVTEGWPVHASIAPSNPDHVREIWVLGGRRPEISPATRMQRDETGVLVAWCASVGPCDPLSGSSPIEIPKGLGKGTFKAFFHRFTVSSAQVAAPATPTGH